jgi:glutamyl/glutaminyl-tRNA synthetase
VLARSDASYTYLFAVVVDDHDSNISHVIRGEEHLSNVPKQELIYRALGWEAPEWVHIPMILDRERHKLSKRSGAISIGSYRESGWSPEALTSYLATLSWSYAPTDRISDPMELSRVFDLDSVALVSPVHDEERMRYFGRLSVASTPIETLLDECLDILILNTGITNGLGPEMLLLIEELRPLCATTEELKLAIASALATPEHDEGQLEEPKWMPALAERLANLPNTNWTFENVKSCIKAFQTELAIKGRDFYHTLRLKITGREDGAPLALIISCLGKNIAIERILRR